MKLLPSEHFDIQVPFSTAEVRTRMRSIVSPPIWNPNARLALFEGTVRKSSFCLTWRLAGRDPFMRFQIEGSMFDQENGCRLAGEVALHPVLQAFLGFLVASSILGSLTAASNWKASGPTGMVLSIAAIAAAISLDFFVRRSLREVRTLFESFFSAEYHAEQVRAGT